MSGVAGPSGQVSFAHDVEDEGANSDENPNNHNPSGKNQYENRRK